MSASDRHIGKIKLIRQSLFHGSKTLAEIVEDTGLHQITIRERLHEAQAWGFVTFDENEKWSLKK